MVDTRIRRYVLDSVVRILTFSSLKKKIWDYSCWWCNIDVLNYVFSTAFTSDFVDFVHLVYSFSSVLHQYPCNSSISVLFVGTIVQWMEWKCMPSVNIVEQFNKILLTVDCILWKISKNMSGFAPDLKSIRDVQPSDKDMLGVF